jgi:hypothetical protein
VPQPRVIYIPRLTEEYIRFSYISPILATSPDGESPKLLSQDIQAHTRTIHKMTIQVLTYKSMTIHSLDNNT